MRHTIQITTHITHLRKFRYLVMKTDFKFTYNRDDNEMNILLTGKDGKFHAEYNDNFLFQTNINLDLNVELTDIERERLFQFINHIPNVDRWIMDHQNLSKSIQNGTVRDDYVNFTPEEKTIAKLYLEEDKD